MKKICPNCKRQYSKKVCPYCTDENPWDSGGIMMPTPPEKEISEIEPIEMPKTLSARQAIELMNNGSCGD
jgi:RNA polymerase subunit RPABC4/transcription elongation factor Spt4